MKIKMKDDFKVAVHGIHVQDFKKGGIYDLAKDPSLAKELIGAGVAEESKATFKGYQPAGIDRPKGIGKQKKA